MEDQPIVEHRPRTFSREEKVAIVFLIIAGIGGLFFGFKYLGKNLSAPFVFSYTGETLLTAEEQQSAEQEAMKSRDTDEDTLSDYDEIYLYKTSAYLADSDSDGYNDATELESGNDPNCPNGKTCTTSIASADAAIDESEAILSGLEEPVPPDLQAAQSELDQSNPFAGAENISAAELRKLLAENGADPAVLEQISDEDLMQMYAEAVAQLQTAQSP